MKLRPLTECEQLQKQIDLLTKQVASLERKLALAYRASEQKALAMHERWVTAISPEVEPIKDRIVMRLK